uniref:Uncharacterized protein n=1 Tax=Clytia hemisphaerica TaxID=252671 RepID=A0A7M5V6A9_9CNID|eukprot:TCONS_00012483-protein
MLYLLRKILLFGCLFSIIPGKQITDIRQHSLMFDHSNDSPRINNSTNSSLEDLVVKSDDPVSSITGHRQHIKNHHSKRGKNNRIQVQKAVHLTKDNKASTEFLKSCNKICSCSTSLLPSSTPLSSSSTTIIGNATKLPNYDYTINCSSMETLQRLGKLQFHQKSEKSISMTVRDSIKTVINGSCFSTNENNKDGSQFCFPSATDYPLLKSVKELKFSSFPKLTSLGNKDTDFFSLIPNVKSLTLELKTRHNVNVHLSNTALNLKELIIILSPEESMNFDCISKTCFPAVLKTFRIEYQNKSSISLHNSTKQFSRTVKDAQIDLQGDVSNQKMENLLEGVKIKRLKINLMSSGDSAISLKRVKVNKSFIVTMTPTTTDARTPIYHHYKQLNEIYDNYNLKRIVKIKLIKNNNDTKQTLNEDRDQQVSVIIGKTHERFRRTFFETCHFTNTILTHSNETIFDKKRLYIRALSYDLSKIEMLFDVYEEVVVTAYYVFISRTFKVPRKKSLTVHYFKIGAFSQGKKLQNSVDVDPGKSEFSLQDLNVLSVPFQQSTDVDPIFTRAIALCISQNIGGLLKRQAGSKLGFNLEIKDFWYVSMNFPRNLTFNQDFDLDDETMAWEAVLNMNKYLRMLNKDRNTIKEMSGVFLRNLNDGTYLLSQYGTKILEKEENAKNLGNEIVSIEEVEKEYNKFQWLTLDHAYHIINLYRDRLSYALDSHTNGRPLLYQLVSMFNKYKKKVDEDEKDFARINKSTNSFTSTKMITSVVKALALLFEDQNLFEHTLKSIESEWKPKSTENVVENLRNIRRLVLSLDDVSVAFSKIKPKIEGRESKFHSYVENVSKLVNRILKKKKSNETSVYKKIRENLRRLDILKQERLWPDQIVKLTICINDLLEAGKSLDGDITARRVFDKIPEPLSFYNPTNVNAMFNKGLNVSIDTSLQWSGIKTWLVSVLNSTSVNHMFQKLEVRYPILNMVDIAEDIVQEMLSNYGYQMTVIELYQTYLVNYQKALVLHTKASRSNTQNDVEDKNKLIREFRMDLESEVLNLKIELIGSIRLWCDTYFYKNFQSCPVDYRGFNIVDSLKDILNDVDTLSKQDPSTTKALKQPRTSFTQEITHEEPKYCRCFNDAQNPSKRTDYMSKFACAQRQIKIDELRDTTSLNDLQDIANDCLNNKIKQLHTFNAFTFKINLDDREFFNKDTIIVNSIDIVLLGANTINKELKLFLTSTGVYRTRVGKDTFLTYEDTSLHELVYTLTDNPMKSIIEQGDIDKNLLFFYNNWQQQSLQTPAGQPSPPLTARSVIPTNDSLSSHEISPTKRQDGTTGTNELSPINAANVNTPASDIKVESNNIENKDKLESHEISTVDVNKVKSDIHSFQETVKELKNSILNSEDSQPTMNADSTDKSGDTDNNIGDQSKVENMAILPKYKMKLDKSPFTTWTVILSKDKNPGLNIKTIKKITIRISGTFRSYIHKNTLFL